MTTFDYTRKYEVLSREELEKYLDGLIRDSAIHSWEVQADGSILIRPVKLNEHITVSVTRTNNGVVDVKLSS